MLGTWLLIVVENLRTVWFNSPSTIHTSYDCDDLLHVMLGFVGIPLLISQ